MTEKKLETSANPTECNHAITNPLAYLAVLGSALLLIFGAITWLSSQFRLSTPGQDRPILLVLGLLGVAFLVYLGSIAIAVRSSKKSNLTFLIVGFAVAFRLTVLFSTPIQEVDLHRYIWDGVVCAEGISPYRYSPDQILAANPHSSPELSRLARIRDNDPGLNYILNKLHKHFGYLPTVYPPTSQAIFALSAKTTPRGATYVTRVRIMKAWLILFDIGVVLLLIKLLSLCGKPIGLSIAYAWCPLVIKEVANSGHLDAIAVFFSTWVVYLLAISLVKAAQQKNNPTQVDRWNGWRRSLTAILLAAAVGAKLYPIVLAPLVLLISLRQFGWRQTVVPAFVFVGATLFLVWPMLPHSAKPQTKSVASIPMPDTVPASANVPPSPAPSDGITTFLKYWEMNDFLFMLGVENLKPTPLVLDPSAARPPKVWFSFVPESTRKAIIAPITRLYPATDSATPTENSIPATLAAFLTTRALLSFLFLGLAIWFAWKFSRNPDPTQLGQAAFLTLAWFWLLSPTQNPWYWMWALPFLPFAKSRAWYAMSGLLLCYYLRFWLEYHYSGQPVAGTRYQGTAFFDFVVTWLEFGPWFLWLIIEGYCRRRQPE